MNRRSFAHILSALLGAAAFPLVGCHDKENARSSIAQPPFSATHLHESLERLRSAYENKGMHVSEHLLPPLSEEKIRHSCSWFPVALPPEIIALYTWHNGQAKGAWDEKHPFWFRDCSFINLDLVKQEHLSMTRTYGRISWAGIDLATCFPFAAFNGGWYIFPCKGQSLDDRFRYPVISVFQGIEIYYYSLDAMLETCIDWVNQPDFGSSYSREKDANELAIWKKHNPGIFEKFGR